MHHFSTNQEGESAEVTDYQGGVPNRIMAALCELSTVLQIFCTKTALCVYADGSGIRLLLTCGVNR